MRGTRLVAHGDITIEYDFDNYHERLMAYELQGEEGFAFLAPLLRPGDTFVDAGTNAGLYSAAAANKVGSQGHVWSIEANPALNVRLKRNVMRNEAHFPNWHLVEHALADRLGAKIEFHLSEFPTWSSVQPLDASEKPTETILVEATTLDELGKTFGKVRLLKIDIEGSEILAFRGAKNWLASADGPDFILTECNDPVLKRFGSSASELLALLESNGYAPYTMRWASWNRPTAVALARELPGTDVNFDLLMVHQRAAKEFHHLLNQR